MHFIKIGANKALEGRLAGEDVLTIARALAGGSIGTMSTKNGYTQIETE
jgi:hypothetical protein